MDLERGYPVGFGIPYAGWPASFHLNPISISTAYPRSHLFNPINMITGNKDFTLSFLFIEGHKMRKQQQQEQHYNQSSMIHLWSRIKTYLFKDQAKLQNSLICGLILKPQTNKEHPSHHCPHTRSYNHHPFIKRELWHCADLLSQAPCWSFCPNWVVPKNLGEPVCDISRDFLRRLHTSHFVPQLQRMLKTQ